MEIQTTSADNSVEHTLHVSSGEQTLEVSSAEQNMQVLQVLLELVHPQGSTVQIAQESNRIQIHAEEGETEPLQNVTSIQSDLENEGMVITYDSVSGAIGSIAQHQPDTIQTQGGSVCSTQMSNNIIFEVSSKPEPETLAVSHPTGSITTPQSSVVEIPMLNIGLEKSKKGTKSEQTLEALEAKYQFECSLCKKLCKSQRSLEKHMQKELKMKPHICDTCNKRFKNVAGLQNHQKLHTGEKPYNCTICDIAFANRSTYNYHNERKHSDKVYICQCSKTFKTKACLRAHLKNHTFQGPKRYKCQYCGLRLKTKHYKNEHERIHTNERPFKCRQGCEKAFRRSGARNDHERTVHLKENKEPCKYCGHLYDKREIKNHELVHTGEKPFACPYCESKYTQRKVLNKHIRRKHQDKEVPPPPPKTKVEKFDTVIKSPGKSKKGKKLVTVNKDTPSTVQIQVYRCMYCVKLFNNINHLTEHEKTHMKDHHYECSRCGKTFQRPEGLTRHEGKHAGGFRCYTCGKVFTTLTKMQEHHREHFLRCALCKHTFQTQEKLNEHMKKHKKKSDDSLTSTYECKYCQKSFLRKVGLKEHQRIHLERIKCPLCEKMFVSYYLPKHLRTHSGDHPYTCMLCPNRHYTTPNALRTHMRRRHPVQKIEIKHKKGSDKAQIQVSEKPQKITIAMNSTVNDCEEALPLHMEVTKEQLDKTSKLKEEEEVAVAVNESQSMTKTNQTKFVIRDAIHSESEFVVPIEISDVIQQAAAANNIQMEAGVTRQRVAQLVNQEGTVTTVNIVDTLSQTVQEESTIIGEIVDSSNIRVNLQDGGDAQTGQETSLVSEMESNSTVALQGDQQIVFTFQ